MCATSHVCNELMREHYYYLSLSLSLFPPRCTNKRDGIVPCGSKQGAKCAMHERADCDPRRMVLVPTLEGFRRWVSVCVPRGRARAFRICARRGRQYVCIG